MLTMDVINQSDSTVAGVRLRVDHARIHWPVVLGATFLTADEMLTWQSNKITSDNSRILVLPELPPIPPRSLIRVSIYGDVESGKVTAVVPGASSELVETVNLDKTWPISWYVEPTWVPWIAFAALLTSIKIANWFFLRIKNATEQQFAYRFAANEARFGRCESAVSLLTVAIQAGFKDFDALRSDSHFNPIRNRPEFITLLASRQK